VLGVGEEIRTMAATMEDGDLVASPQRLGGDVPAEEDRAPEDERMTRNLTVARSWRPAPCGVLSMSNA
jgi:hypothetical protein